MENTENHEEKRLSVTLIMCSVCAGKLAKTLQTVVNNSVKGLPYYLDDTEQVVLTVFADSLLASVRARNSEEN